MSQETPAAKPTSGFYVRMEYLAEQNDRILEKLEELAKEVHTLETAVKVDLAKVHGRVDALEKRLDKMDSEGRRSMAAVATGGAAGGGVIAAVAELVRHLLSQAGG